MNNTINKYEILLVEDAPHWRKLLKRYLLTAVKQKGGQANIFEAENQEQACEFLERNKDWNLLCTDIGLSKEGLGNNEGTLLVSLAAERKIPTVIVSGTPGVTPQNVRDYLRKDKVVDFFYKQTFDRKIFIEVVEQQLQKSTNREVFICYAHADNESDDQKKRWLDRFLIFLNPLLSKQGEISVYSDKDISIGDNWHTQIQNRLYAASAAALLVSPYFLDSDYVANNELPVLLKKASKGGLKIFPIIISPCSFHPLPAMESEREGW